MIYLLAFLAPLAHAAQFPALSSYFEERISGFENQTSSLTPGAGGDIVLTDFNVQLSPTVTFGMNDVLGLSISPELDLVFTPVKDETR